MGAFVGCGHQIKSTELDKIVCGLFPTSSLLKVRGRLM